MNMNCYRITIIVFIVVGINGTMRLIKAKELLFLLADYN